jgi:hypothetical protein
MCRAPPTSPGEGSTPPQAGRLKSGAEHPSGLTPLSRRSQNYERN